MLVKDLISLCCGITRNCLYYQEKLHRRGKVCNLLYRYINASLFAQLKIVTYERDFEYLNIFIRRY